MIPIRRFTRELRKQGFEFCFRDSSGGRVVTQFAKRQGDRELRVQLWAMGGHRVCHGTYSKLPNGVEGFSETTLPTDFETVREMLLAIEFEWVRPSTPPRERRAI